MTLEQFGKLTAKQALILSTSANKGKRQDDRNYFKNVATVFNREIQFISDDELHSHNNSTHPIEKFKFSTDDLSEDQKNNIDRLMKSAIERKQQEFKQRV